MNTSTKHSLPGISLSDIKNESQHQLLIDVLDRYKHHLDRALDGSKFYGFLVKSFAFAVPIYSAILTFIISTDFNSGFLKSKVFQGVLGLGLTILTIISNVLKPYERYMESSNTLLLLRDWKMDLVLSLQRIDLKQDEEFFKLIERKEREMSNIGKAMLEKLTPSTKNQ